MTETELVQCQLCSKTTENGFKAGWVLYTAPIAENWEGWFCPSCWDKGRGGAKASAAREVGRGEGE